MDRIKKLKIKKQDGTFSDYIPIGADAGNIDTTDGESVETKLNKKPYYYNSVADMKADTKLKAGDMAVTLGYYSVNDGGSGLYQIVDDNTLVDDGGSIHNLENGLKAKLISEDGVANVKQFGAKGDGITDDTAAIQKAIDNFKIVIFNGNYSYLISTHLDLHSNLKIIGETGSKIITQNSSNNHIVFAKGQTESTSIFRYIATEDLTSGNYYIYYDNKYFNFILPEIEVGDIIDINTVSKIAVLNHNKTENEILVTETSAGTGTNLTNSCDKTVSVVTKNYLENIIIDGLHFENLNYINNKQNVYALYFENVKDIVVKNCKSEKLGLIWIGNTYIYIAGDSLQNDVYVQYGLNETSLSKNIIIKNNIIEGLEVAQSEGVTTNISGIYLNYLRDAKIINNKISYLAHGITFWGGNVGLPYYNEKNMLHFVKDVLISNNNIYKVKAGGIWGGRASNIIVSNNIINICGDVGIDFEGCIDCIADSNISNDCIAGCLANFHFSDNIIFSNNKCCDNSILSTNRFIYNHTNGNTYYVNTEFRETKIKYVNNIFHSIKRLNYFGHLSNSYGIIEYINNTFINTRIESDNNDSPTLVFNGNIFKLTSEVAQDLLDSPNGKNCLIFIRPNNHDGGTIAYIENNIFDVKTAINSNSQTPGNNSIFDGIYAIGFRGSAYNRPTAIKCNNNKILGFRNAVYLNHIASGGSKLFLYFSNNLISGSIDNLSDNEKGFIVYENNKTILNSNNNRFKSVEDNYPNTIPSSSSTGGYYQGTKIYFDEPDSDGYTGAICTASGNPGI